MATQAEKDAAKLKVTNAKTAMDNAYATMSSYYASLKECVCGRKLAGNCTGVMKAEDYPSQIGVSADKCQSVTIGDGKTSCDTIAECNKRRGTYNSSITTWENAADAYDKAQDEYETISGEIFDAGQGNAEREASSIRTRYLVFGGIVIVLIIAAVFVIMKYKK